MRLQVFARDYYEAPCACLDGRQLSPAAVSMMVPLSVGRGHAQSFLNY
jgi:hypothetical protein